MIERVKIAFGLLKIWVATQLRVYVVPDGATLHMHDCECDGPIVVSNTSHAEFCSVNWKVRVYPAAIIIKERK